MAHMMEGDEDLDDLRREELSKNTTYFQVSAADANRRVSSGNWEAEHAIALTGLVVGRRASLEGRVRPRYQG